MITFGFVFIHPFVDGNGRIHRYLIHHVLMKKKYVPAGMIFPVSSIILERLDEYRKVLEAFSMPRFDMIEWRPDDNNNVKVFHETIDFFIIMFYKNSSTLYILSLKTNMHITKDRF